MKKKKTKSPAQNSYQSSSNNENAFKPGNSICLFLLALVIVFVVIIRLQFLHIPFERDEGIYSYMGQLVLDGKVPYIGFYEMKPPMLYYSYAALIFIFGKTVEAVHIAFMFLNILTIIFLYFIGKKLLRSRSAGLVSAASYAILSLAPFVSGFTAQSEHIISFFLTAGLLLLLFGIETKRLFYFFFSGLLLSLTFMVKQNGVFFMAFGGIAIMIYYLLQKPVDWKELMKRMAAFSAGAALVFAVITGILYWQGALQECLFWTYYFSKGYVSIIPPSEGFANFTHTGSAIIEKNILLWLLAATGFVLPFFLKRQLSLFARIFIPLFAVVSLLAVTPGLRFFGHYFIFFMPAVALLVDMGFVCIKELLLKYVTPNKATLLALSIFGVAVLYNIFAQREYYFNHDDKSVLRMVYGMNPFPEAKVMGDYIKQNSTEKDSIGMFGSETEIFFYADRRCPSKHCLAYQMLSTSPRAHDLQKEYERDMEASVPRYFVAFKDPDFFTPIPSDTGILNWLSSFLAAKYNVVGVIDLISADNTQYVWGEDIKRYTVKSRSSCYVFERKRADKSKI